MKKTKEQPPVTDGQYIVAGYEISETGRGKKFVGAAWFDADTNEWNDGNYTKPDVEYVYWQDMPDHPDI
jgi:hypothetical protein